jgi:uncharacterized surface protein with fasciclin (FAS1) repeats
MSSRALRKVAPLAIVTALAVAACADSEDSTTTPSTAAATTTLAADAATTTSPTATTGSTETTVSGATTTEGDDTASTLPSIEDLQAALQEGDLSTIAQAIDVIGVERLIGSEEFTLLAPNNDAFQSLTPSELTDLLANPTELTDLLKNHLVAEKLTAADLRAMTSIETAAGRTLPVELDGDTLTIGGAQVVEADRDAGPGVIHVIDTVLLIES